MDNKRPDEKARESLRQTADKIHSVLDKRKTVRLLACLAGVCILLAALVIVLFSVKVKSIEISGDLSVYNESEIIEASGIGPGDSIFKKTSFGIERAIRRNLPITSEVNVSKKIFDGRITIEIEFTEYEFFIEYGGKFYGVDGELNVLDTRESKSEYFALGGRFLVIDSVQQPNIGQRLIFTKTVEETDTEGVTVHEIEKPDYYDYVTVFLEYLKNSNYYDLTDAVILDSKFNITVIYDSKYKIVFGGYGDLDIKFRVLDEIFYEGTLSRIEKGVIDLTDPSAAVARFDETLDFSEYLE